MSPCLELSMVLRRREEHALARAIEINPVSSTTVRVGRQPALDAPLRSRS